MKSAKELFARLQSDAAFAEEFGKKLQEKRETGTKDIYETLIPVAANYGYEVTPDDIDELSKATTSEEMSEEELGKVAGGTSCLTALTFVLTASVFYTACETILLSIDELAK